MGKGPPHRAPSGASIAAAVLVAMLVWLVVYPNFFVLGAAVAENGRPSLAGFARFFQSRAELEALWNSVWISAASVLLSAIVGVPLAFLLDRATFPGRRIVTALASLPVVLPPLVGVIAFVFLFGESGFLTRGVQWIARMQNPPWRLDGPGAVLLVHAYSMYVYFFLFTGAALRRLDQAQMEAAASLGAGRWRQLTRVTLPLLAPGLGGAALLVFMTSMASFSAPYIFGGGFRVLTTRIYASKLNGDASMVAVETIVLALASLLFLAMLQRFERSRAYTGTGKGVARSADRSASLRARIAVGALAWLAAVVLLLPHLTVFLVSFVPEGSWTTQIVPPRYSFENYRELFGDPEQLRPVLNSLRMAAIATAANVILAFGAAYLMVRRRARLIRTISTLIALPWALPGTVIAIALATAFSRNQPWAARLLLVGTGAILPLAYFIRNIPLVTRAALTSFQQLDPSLEDAASSLGASPAMAMRRVLLPLVLPGLLAGAMLAFVTALGEFVASILLYTHRTRPISIEILAQLRAYDFGAASAYGVLLTLLMLAAFLAGGRLERESIRSGG